MTSWGLFVAMALLVVAGVVVATVTAVVPVVLRQK